MEKAIYFDMDGTIANLYGVENWLPMLRAEDESPYEVAAPMCNMQELADVINILKLLGFKIGVISWLSKQSSKEYKKKVTKAKREWLSNMFPVAFDEMHFVQYGTPKHRTANVKYGILVDDDDGVREKWERYGGLTINPKEDDIVEELRQIVLYATEGII